MKYNKIHNRQLLVCLLICLITSLTKVWAQNVTNNESYVFKKGFLFAEKYYLHTDRNYYVAGEDIHFKAYSLIGKEEKPVSLSKFLYLNLVDSVGNTVSEKKVRLETRGCFGKIKIPEDLPTGYYTLYAYTRWQRNFGIDAYFAKKLFILNSQTGITTKLNAPQANFEIFFFPEGGVFRAGVENNVVFYCKNKYGQIVNAEGSIVDTNDSIIVNFKSAQNGIGHFTIHPDKNVTYKARYLVDSIQYTSLLPTAKQTELALKFNNRRPDSLYINISTDITQSLFPYKFNIIFEYNGLRYISITDSISEKSYALKLSKNNFLPGLNRFILKNDKDKVIFEKFFNVENKNNAKINVNTEKKKYSAREIVKVNITSLGNNRLPCGANLSVSVSKVEDPDLPINMNLLSHATVDTYLNPHLLSELTTENNAGIDSYESSDNYLITLKPKCHSTSKIFFLPDYSKEELLTGTITNTKENHQINSHKVYVTFLNSAKYTKAISTNQHGEFSTSMGNLTSADKILFQISDTDPTYRIRIDKTYETSFPQARPTNFNFSSNKKAYLKRLMLNYQISDYYSNKETIVAGELKEYSALFYGVPDSSYNLDQYIELPNLEEVLINIVSDVFVKRKKDEYVIDIRNKNAQFLLFPPLLLVDGIPILDINTFMKIPPQEVRRIELINSDYLIGQNVFGGIISLFSINNDFAGIKLSNKSELIEVETAENLLSDKNEDIDIPENNKHQPDFRNTIYWNPNINTNDNGSAELSFYTSDETGKFIITVTGVNDEGKLVISHCVYETAEEIQ